MNNSFVTRVSKFMSQFESTVFVLLAGLVAAWDIKLATSGAFRIGVRAGGGGQGGCSPPSPATLMMTNFHLNTTVVAIFPNVCLWRRNLCSDLALTLENCIEPPSYARTAYVVAIWPSFLFDSFVKIWATCEIFLGKRFTEPWSKVYRTPMAFRNI